MSQSNDSGLNLDHLEALANNLKLLTCAIHPAGYTAKEARMFNLGFYAGTASSYESTVQQIALARRAALANQPAPTVPASDLVKRLREHDDERLYLEADMLMSEAADALDRAHQPAQEQADPLSATKIDRIARNYFSEQWAIQHAKDAIHDAFAESRKVAAAAQQEPVAAPQQTGDSKDGAAIAAFKKWHQEVGDQDCEYTWLQAWTAAQLSPDLKKRMADALNVTLWLYRRLPGAYGRPPFVDAALLEMAKIADIDAQGSIAERAAQLDGGQEGSAS